MTLDFEQTQEDYVDFYYYFHWSTPEKYWYRIKVRMAIIIATCCMPYIMVHKIENYGYIEYMIVISGIICAIFLGRLVKFIGRQKIQRSGKRDKNIYISGPGIIQFETEKIIIKSPAALSEVSWSATEKLGETIDHLFLFTSANKCISIPKRIFKTGDEMKEVKNLICERMKGDNLIKRKLDILKLISWITIGLWIIRPAIFRLFRIDFATPDIAGGFRLVWIVFIPAAVGILIVRSWKELKLTIKRAIVLILAIILTASIIVILNFFSGLCEWSFSEPIYINKKTGREIRYRELNCGATDTDPSYDMVETMPLGPFFVKYKYIQVDYLNKDYWEKQ
jgi:hypothetical protein